MERERFPQRKYLRQLRAMRWDLEEWERQYAEAVDSRGDDWIRGQFERRLNVLRATRVAIAEAFDALEDLPRLS